ncbi:MAG: membrane protein [Thermoplasmatales archaeon A-plasma]|nr:MAG: membrane protein [Thermoplasmatales archaeon A-plasma]
MLITRTLNFKSMYKSVQWPILIFVGTYLILGAAIISTGLSVYIAGIILGSPLILFVVTVILANTIGNVGSAVIMGPVAMGFPDPLKAIVVVAMAASCTFITPFGNQSNLIVQAAGSYTAKDYALYGSMITAVAMIITLLYAYL